MLTRSFPVNVGICQSEALSGESVVAQPKRTPLVVSIARLVFVSLTILILGVVIVARLQRTPTIVEPPSSYLPGNPKPKDAKCFQSDYLKLACLAHFNNIEVYFDYDSSAGMIIHTAIQADAYTIGELIAAWGTPTGVTQDERVIYVRWGTRSAFVFTDSFQPDSRIELITYDLEPQGGSPWHGFTSSKN